MKIILLVIGTCAFILCAVVCIAGECDMQSQTWYVGYGCKSGSTASCLIINAPYQIFCEGYVMTPGMQCVNDGPKVNMIAVEDTGTCDGGTPVAGCDDSGIVYTSNTVLEQPLKTVPC